MANKEYFTSEFEDTRLNQSTPDSIEVSDWGEARIANDFDQGESDPSLSQTSTTRDDLALEFILGTKAADEVFESANKFDVFPDDLLIINDIYLHDVPTASISINSATDVFVGETLRSKAPVVESEGHQDFVLNLNLIFPPGPVQQYKLRRLMAQLKNNPYTFIYSNNVKKKLGVSKSETTIFVLEAANMRSTAETVGVITLNLQFHYFNYKPFSKHYWYNTLFSGYTKERPSNKNLELTQEINLLDLSGHEASDHTISKVALAIRNDIRDGMMHIAEHKKTNVAIDMPSESDAWMFFADHLEKDERPISESGSDYVGFELRKYEYIIPPGSEFADSNTTLSDTLGSGFKPIPDIYRADLWSDVVKEREEARKPATTATNTRATGAAASTDTYNENTSNAEYRGKYKVKAGHRAPVKFHHLARKLDKHVTLVDESGLVHPNAIKEMDDVVQPLQEHYQGKFHIDPACVIIFQKIADRFPGKTIQILSAIRPPGGTNVKGSHHPFGRAFDILVPGVHKDQLWAFLKTVPYVFTGWYDAPYRFVHFNTIKKFDPIWQKNGSDKKYIKGSAGRGGLSYGPDDLATAVGETDSDLENAKVQAAQQDKERQIQDEKIAASKSAKAKRVDKKKAKKVAKKKETEPERLARIQREEMDLKEQEAREKELYEKERARNAANTKVRQAWIDSNGAKGLHYYYKDPKVRNVFYKDLRVDISSDINLQRSRSVLPNLVCSAISLSFGHRIAPMKLVNQAHYSYQFLGAGNKSGQMVFTFAGEEGKVSANILKELFSKARETSREWSSIIQGAGSINTHDLYLGASEQNNILALSGIQAVIISNIEETSSPEGVDKHQLVVEFIAQDFTEEKFEQKFTTPLNAKKRIIRSILKYVHSTKKGNLNTISPDSTKVKLVPSGPRPFETVKDTPLWVAELIAEAYLICKDLEPEMTPLHLQASASKTWKDIYADWGAGNIFKGSKNGVHPNELHSTYADKDRGGNNPLAWLTEEERVEELRIRAIPEATRSFKDKQDFAYYWQGGKARAEVEETDLQVFKLAGTKTRDMGWNTFNIFLERMSLLVPEWKKHLSDEAVMEVYFPNTIEEVIGNVTEDISSCYLDLNLPFIPNSSLRVTPEFYIYDDSHEDPAISSLTDPTNMEMFLERHVEEEVKSVANYMEKCFLGGSYLSKNLPRILENRASEHNRSEGEREYSKAYNFYVDGCKSWEPIYHRYEDMDQSIEGQKKWLQTVSAHTGAPITKEEAKNNVGAVTEDQQFNFLKKIVSLSPYIRDNRQWLTPVTEEDNSNLIKAMYGDAEKTLLFGPNPIYGPIDEMNSGKISSVASKQVAKGVTAAQNKIQQSGYENLFTSGFKDSRLLQSMPDSNILASTSDNAVAFGSLREESSTISSIDSAIESAWQVPLAVGDSIIDSGFAPLAMLGLAFLGPLGVAASVALGAQWGIQSTVDNVDAAKGAGLAIAAKKYEHHYSKVAEENTNKMIAQTVARSSLTNKRNDLSMRRAFPTFKIYFIEDDSNENEIIEKTILRAFDDFYSYSAIQEIKITRSREIAGDMAIIRMTNVGGKLLRKRFGESDRDLNKRIAVERQGIFADTEKEHPFEKMILQDGVKTQIRLGYSSNPANLETVFLGQIVEVSVAEGGKILEIACQGYGAELESVELGPLEDGPVFFSSQQILSGALIQDSIANFGRQSRFNQDNPAAMRHSWTGGTGQNLLAGLSPSNLISEWSTRHLESTFNRYRFLNYQQDDNIYAPPPEVYSTTWMRFWNNACIYRPLKQTPWEIFKEHELRHPGYVSLAVPYGHDARMTMFFGSKMQHYWSRPPTALEIELSNSSHNEIVKMRSQGSKLLQAGLLRELMEMVKKSPKLGMAFYNDILIGGRFDAGYALGELFGRYVPFRNYIYLDGDHHILKNEIRTSVDGTFNEVEIYYTEDEGDIDDPDGDDIEEHVNDLRRGDAGLLAVKLDENIPESSIRSYRGEFPSCVTVDMAKRYAQGIFARTMRNAYQGELCIIGNEKLKPYDICYLNDNSINMTGPIEVRSVTHIFNRNSGFVSVITPDLCLEVNDYYTASVMDVGATASTVLWEDLGMPMGGEALKGLVTLGQAAGVKFMTWSQEGAPVIATPLTFGGKPFISNSFGPNRVSLYLCAFGKWTQYWDDLGTSWRKFDIGEAVQNKMLHTKLGIYNIFGPGETGGVK